MNPRKHHDLRHDALKAEDLGIRYADSVNGRLSGHFQGFTSYDETLETCTKVLFSMVAREHNVTVNEVRRSLTRRPLAGDFAVVFSFVVFYAAVAYRITQRVLRDFPIDGTTSRVARIVALTVTSVFLSFIAVLVGEWYALAVESHRLGTGHLSFRADRVPWGHHRVSLFVGGVVLFWLIAVLYHIFRKSRAREVSFLRPSRL